jgi:hypothetical protein
MCRLPRPGETNPICHFWLHVGRLRSEAARGARAVWTECQTKPISAFSGLKMGVRVRNKTNLAGRTGRALGWRISGA